VRPVAEKTQFASRSMPTSTARSVRSSSQSIRSRRAPPVSGNKAELKALLAEADAQEANYGSGAPSDQKGYRA
jgi:hypothetical protein